MFSLIWSATIRSVQHRSDRLRDSLGGALIGRSGNRIGRCFGLTYFPKSPAQVGQLNLQRLPFSRLCVNLPLGVSRVRRVDMAKNALHGMFQVLPRFGILSQQADGQRKNLWEFFGILSRRTFKARGVWLVTSTRLPLANK